MAAAATAGSAIGRNTSVVPEIHAGMSRSKRRVERIERRADEREDRGDRERRRQPPVQRVRAIHLPVVVGELVVDALFQVDPLEFLDRHRPGRGRSRVQDVERAREPARAREVEVLQQRCSPRQAPGGERRAAEFRRQPAAHPAVVRVHLVPQHDRRAEREADAGQLEPGQREQVQAVADHRRADDRRDDVRDDRRDDQPPESRRAMGRVEVALLLEQENVVGRLEGIDRPGARASGRPFRSASTGLPARAGASFPCAPRACRHR